MRTVLRFVLGAVFCVAGALKFTQPLDAVLAVGAYRVLPVPLAVLGGLWLPGVEVAVGVALLTGVARRGAAFGAAGLAALFLIFTASARLRGLDVSCGCFGPLSIADQAGPAMILVDAGLLLLAVALLLLPARRRPGIRIRP